MKSPPLTARLIVLFCAALLLCVQVLGLHYHRHADAEHLPPADAIGVHLWDAGLHDLKTAVAPAHAAVDAHATHSGTDLDVDQLATGLAKLLKIWMAAVVLLVAVLWLTGSALPFPLRRARPCVASHPGLFVLRPPSHAPPLKLSLVR